MKGQFSTGYIARVIRTSVLLALVSASSSYAQTDAACRQRQFGRFSEWSAAVNLGPVVNSRNMEFWPMISPNGLSLYRVEMPCRWLGAWPCVRSGASATLLPDGRVLIVFESGGAAELYDPYNGAFTRTGSPQEYVYGLPTTTLLMNGKVLVAGYEWSPELYDSWAGTFTATGKTITAHVGYTATLLPDGAVLLAGSDLFGSLANAELYDSVAGAFTATGNMITARGSLTATLLNNGQVLITGGHSPYTGVSFPATTSSAEIYHPAVLVPAPQLFSVSGDGRGQGAILHAGTARVVTASDPGVPGEVLEIYGTGLKDESVITPQVAIGGRLAETLYFGNAPGFTSLSQINARVPGGVAPGAGVPVRLMYLSRPSNAVTIGLK